LLESSKPKNFLNKKMRVVIPKEVFSLIGRCVDSPKTFLALTLTCKAARFGCKEVRGSMEYLFQYLYIQMPISRYGAWLRYITIKDNESEARANVLDYETRGFYSHESDLAVCTTGFSYGAGKLTTTKMRRIDVLKRLCVSSDTSLCRFCFE